jgi:hypothetical protein
MTIPPFHRDTIDAWASDFADTPAYGRLEGAAKEHAPAIVHAFLEEACGCGGCAPADLTEDAVRHALLDHLPRLDLPAAARAEIPSIVRAFLETLQDAGRLGNGHALGRFAGALAPAFLERLNPKGGMRAPPLKPASTIGRNDPCPCGSGRKYKKCCGR